MHGTIASKTIKHLDFCGLKNSTLTVDCRSSSNQYWDPVLAG